MVHKTDLSLSQLQNPSDSSHRCTETTMALEQEELLCGRLFTSAYDGDLSRMKECAERLDHGEGLVEIYTKNRGPNGSTALHCGAIGGRTQICKYLIEVVGLDVNMQDRHGETVLNRAIISHDHQTVAYLIQKGANMNLANNEGYAALHTAAREDLKEILHLLISSGADLEALSFHGTPLHCALIHGKREIMEILLDNNANPNAMSVHVCTPLMVSIVAQWHECIDLFLKAGADPDLGGGQVTPLGIAASRHYNEVIKCLLKAGANPNIINNEGMTPLEVAALTHNYEGIMILFPKTSPVPSIPDWTIGGIMENVHSEEASKQRAQKRKDCCMEAKSKGAEAFKKKDYLEAISWYSWANICDPEEATVLSNRSLCWARLNNGDRALDDAEACITRKPCWSKAHYRKGVACELLKDFSGAHEAYDLALKLYPGNEEIQTAFMNVRDIQLARLITEQF